MFAPALCASALVRSRSREAWGRVELSAAKTRCLRLATCESRVRWHAQVAARRRQKRPRMKQEHDGS